MVKKKYKLGDIKELKKGGFYKLENVFSIPNESPMDSSKGRTKKKWVKYF